MSRFLGSRDREHPLANYFASNDNQNATSGLSRDVKPVQSFEKTS